MRTPLCYNTAYWGDEEIMDNENLTDSSIGKRNYILFTIAIFATFAVFGVAEVLKGTAIPRIKIDFSLTELQIGFLLAVGTAGYLVACSFTAALAKIIGIKTCHIMGLIVMSLSGVLIFFTPDFSALVLAFFILHLGFGIVEIAVGVIAAKIFTRKTGTMMNLAHFFFGSGATLSPIISTSIMTMRFGDQVSGWRYVYLIVLSFALVPAIPSLIGRFKKKNREEKSSGYALILKKPALWLLVAILSLVLICEVGFGSWFVLFLETSYSFSSESAALHLTLYFLFFTLGRLVLGPVIDKIGFINTLVIATAFSGAIVTIGVLCGQAGIPILVLVGVAVAPVFPTVMAVIAKLFSDQIEHAMTAIMTAHGIILTPASFIVGAIINQARIIFTNIYGEAGVSMAYSAGFMFFGLCCFGAFAFTLVLRARQKKAGRLV